MPTILQVQSITKTNQESRHLLSSISFTVVEGERLAIVGETGSGKSTLLKSIGGLTEISSGEVLFRGTNVEGPEEKLVAGHEQISYLSQHFELPKFITVRDFLSRNEIIKVEDPRQIFKACRIKHLLDRDTRALSGGEKQRVALTKELLKSPEILLLDEPFSNLDFNHKRIIREVLDEIERDLSVTIILVAHDPKDVLSWADRVMVLRQGKVVQYEKPKYLYEKPADEYVASLFGAYSLISADVLESELVEKSHSINNKIFLRPHNVHIEQEKPAFTGSVEKVRYYGEFDELTIKADIGWLITNSKVESYQEGQEICIAIKN